MGGMGVSEVWDALDTKMSGLRSSSSNTVVLPPLDWVLSGIGYYQTLCTIRCWVLSDIGYYQTLGTIRHWVISDIGYHHNLGTIRHLVLS